MPIYEYRCEACGHEMEAMQKMADTPLSDCPMCGAPALKRKISAAGFRLKGSGWYETDFKNNNKKKNLAKDDVPSSDTKSSDAKTPDTNKAKESSANKDSKTTKAATNSS